MKSPTKIATISLLLLPILILYLYQIYKKNELKATKEKQYKKEEQFARQYCSTCHEYVGPELLDRATWPRVLNIMRQEMLKQNRTITNDEWIKLQQFYLTYAPKYFHSTPSIKPILQTTFEITTIPSPGKRPFNGTMLQYLPEREELLIGDKYGFLYNLTKDSLNKKTQISNIPINAAADNASLYVLGIGILKPSERPLGQLLLVEENKDKVILDSLKRPVQVQLRKNGTASTDFFVASFGSTLVHPASGMLSFYKNNGASYKEKIVEKLAGAIQVSLVDMDKDGIEEIVSLFTQGNEQINIYQSDFKEVFNKQSTITFPPIYGTNSFDIADLNEDGFLDIIVTNGDNDDYSKVYKSYHGVRIFYNDGHQEFKESYFFPINGASTVKCADMDNDGDMDFVVSAMYPDYFNRTWENLLYFEKEDKEFTPHYFEETPSANWILMEIADIDMDGDQDIITASNNEICGTLPPLLKNEWLKQPLAAKVYYNKTL